MSLGEIDRLMVLMPPGSAKSTYASVIFPAWWFVHHPRTAVIGASNTASLAVRFSRRIRDTISENRGRIGYGISSSDRAAAHWTTTTGGEYYSAGTRGSLVGRRADLIIIDDPVKSQIEADSPSIRERVWEWYQSDVVTRLKPQARILLIMTRWHEDDLGGRLLANEAPEWHTLRLPAFAEYGDPLGRAPGRPLWPEWEDVAALNRKRRSVGERTWSALFQQSPQPQIGSIFDTSKLRIVSDLGDSPPELTVRAWDLAATVFTGMNDPDWTVGLKLARTAGDTYAVLDVIRLRGSSHEVEELISSTAKKDGQAVRIGLPQDPGQAGKSQVGRLTALLSGYHVISSREIGSKSTRTAPIASQWEAGNVAIVRAKWNREFISELRDFPLGSKDDQVDALARAFKMADRCSRSARNLNIPFIIR